MVNPLVDCPLTWARAGDTPGSESIYVVHRETGETLDNVVSISTVTGQMIVINADGSETLSNDGVNYKLMCHPEALNIYRDVWEALQ